MSKHSEAVEYVANLVGGLNNHITKKGRLQNPDGWDGWNEWLWIVPDVVCEDCLHEIEIANHTMSKDRINRYNRALNYEHKHKMSGLFTSADFSYADFWLFIPRYTELLSVFRKIRFIVETDDGTKEMKLVDA